jgi:hypothetical protein
VRAADGRHLNQNPLDELHSIVLREDARFSQPMVFVHRELAKSGLRGHPGLPFSSLSTIVSETPDPLGISPDPADQAFEVFGLGEREADGMIGSLGELLEDLDLAPGVLRGGEDDLLEELRGDQAGA